MIPVTSKLLYQVHVTRSQTKIQSKSQCLLHTLKFNLSNNAALTW